MVFSPPPVSITKDTSFKKFNLIYGFNGSGKSTFSRILNSISNGSLHDSFPENTSFKCNIGSSKIDSEELASNDDTNALIVYNKEFVDQCIRFYDGSLNPVVLIGKEMIDAEKELQEIRSKTEKLSTELVELKSKNAEDFKAASQLRTDLAAEISKKANYKNFNAGHLRRGIEQNSFSKGLSPDDYSAACKRSELAKAKNSLDQIEIDFDFLSWANGVLEALQKSPTLIVLSDLSSNGTLLQWVAEGLNLHDHRENCAFCSNVLPPKRLSDIREMISGEYESHQSLLKELLLDSEGLPEYFDEIRKQVPSDSAVYTDLVTEIREAKDNLYAALDDLRQLSRTISKRIRDKMESPSTAVEVGDLIVDCQKACSVSRKTSKRN